MDTPMLKKLRILIGPPKVQNKWRARGQGYIAKMKVLNYLYHTEGMLSVTLEV